MAAIKAWNIAHARSSRVLVDSSQRLHSRKSSRANGDTSNTVRGLGGVGAKSTSMSTDAVVTLLGIVTMIGRPASTRAARAGGSDQAVPPSSSRNMPVDTYSR